jgi:hypothetical protein
MHYKELTSNNFAELPKGDRINARQLVPDIRKDTRIYIFRNASGSHSCLLQALKSNRKLPDIRGINIAYETFGKPDEVKIPFIHLECTMPAYNDNFTEIVREILADFDAGKDEMAKSTDKVIRKWKHFLSDPENALMNEDEILGLTGELMFLHKLIDAYGPESIKMWTADRGEEDFIWQDYVVEVKATLKERHEHIINGIDQLLVIAERIKYILSMLFIKSTSENLQTTLPALIDDITAMLTEFPEEEELFYRKLKSRGYDARDAAGYLEYKYSMLKGGYFRVDESFPKLTTDELKAPLSPRISKVRYLADLEGLYNLNFNDTDVKTIINYDIL